MPALDLMRSMIRGLPVEGYEMIKADKKELYRDAFFSMKLVEVTGHRCFMATSSNWRT